MAHDLAPLGLQVLAAFRDSALQDAKYNWQPLRWRGLSFANRLGLAGGVDKDAANVESWWKFGPGFIEIGTVTPKAQAPNPGKIFARDMNSLALWNKMGFPGQGASVVRENLHDLPLRRETPIFVNIGKNRTTPNDRAADDYASCVESFNDLADAFVVNISSPNTSGLRELFEPKFLRSFLMQILDARGTVEKKSSSTPVLLKLSPDLERADLATVVETALEVGIDGFIATNTTLARNPGSHFSKEGGVSGCPLAPYSKKALRELLEILGTARKNLLIISTGGVMTPEDVAERLALGADLVQVYTALVFNGPWFFSNVAQHFSR